MRRIVEWYNMILTRCNEVEFDLIREEMEALDDKLRAAVENLTWDSDSEYHYMYIPSILKSN